MACKQSAEPPRARMAVQSMLLHGSCIQCCISLIQCCILLPGADEGEGMEGVQIELTEEEVAAIERWAIAAWRKNLQMHLRESFSWALLV